MTLRRRCTGMAVVAAVVLVGGCGGSDDEPASDATAEQSDASDEVTDDAPGRASGDTTADASDEGSSDGDASDVTSETGEDIADDTADDTGEDDGDDTGADASPGGGVDLSCDEVFSVDEMAEFIGQPVELIESSDAALGSITCSWDSIEDPEDTGDLAFTSVFAQIFTGDPIPAANFIDPTMFEEVTMIDDLGDVAYWEDSFGTTFYVLDGNVAGVFSYIDADFASPGGPTARSVDEVLELFREFDRRIT